MLVERLAAKSVGTQAHRASIDLRTVFAEPIGRTLTSDRRGEKKKKKESRHLNELSQAWTIERVTAVLSFFHLLLFFFYCSGASEM